MSTDARLPSDLSRLDRETAAFLASVESLSEDQLAAPSLCAGWTRADVVAHLASNGRALVKLVDWVCTGVEQAPYESPEARNREIAGLAALPREELVRRARAAAEFFAEQSLRLMGERAVGEVHLHGKRIPAEALVALRISEVVVHHHDLATAWTLGQAHPDSLLDALEAAVRTMRAKGAPGMTLVTEEGDEWVVGDGAVRVGSDRGAMLAWLARGETGRVGTEGTLPVLPSW